MKKIVLVSFLMTSALAFAQGMPQSSSQGPGFGPGRGNPGMQQGATGGGFNQGQPERAPLTDAQKQERFAQHKQEVQKHIGERLNALQQEKTCIDQAANHDALKQCRVAHRQAMGQMRQDVHNFNKEQGHGRRGPQGGPPPGQGNQGMPPGQMR